MSKREIFIETVGALITENLDRCPQEALDYFESMKNIQEKEKPILTENGKKILETMQNFTNEGKEVMFARDIAESLFVSSRCVSGSLRKMIEDGFVTKEENEKPIAYSLTEKGINFKL